MNNDNIKDFKILVKRTQGRDKGKIVWFYNIAVGSIGIFQENRTLSTVKNPLSPPLQYLGIEDKNNKSIYEYDIVKLKEPMFITDTGEIIYIKEDIFIIRKLNTCIGLVSINNDKEIYLLKDITYKEIEIIGNFYENCYK